MAFVPEAILRAARAVGGFPGEISRRFSEPGEEITQAPLRPGEFSPATGLIRLGVSIAAQARAAANRRQALERQRLQDRLTSARIADLESRISERGTPEETYTFTLPSGQEVGGLTGTQRGNLEFAAERRRLAIEAANRSAAGRGARDTATGAPSLLADLDRQVEAFVDQRLPEIQREAKALAVNAITAPERETSEQRRERQGSVLSALSIPMTPDKFKALSADVQAALLQKAVSDFISVSRDSLRALAQREAEPQRAAILKRMRGVSGVPEPEPFVDPDEAFLEEYRRILGEP